MNTTIPRRFLVLTSLLVACHVEAGAKAPVQIWGRQLGTAEEDFAKALAVDTDGNCFLAGATGGDLAAKSARKRDIVVGKFDTTGRRGPGRSWKWNRTGHSPGILRGDRAAADLYAMLL